MQHKYMRPLDQITDDSDVGNSGLFTEDQSLFFQIKTVSKYTKPFYHRIIKITKYFRLEHLTGYVGSGIRVSLGQGSELVWVRDQLVWVRDQS